MAEEKPEKPSLSRRQFVAGAGLGLLGAVATSCLPSSKEPVPALEAITTDIEYQLATSLRGLDIRVERVLRLDGAYLDTKEGLPVFCLPVSGDTSQESPYAIGYFKGGLTLIPSFQVTLNNRGRTELWEILISGYDWEKNELDEAVLDCFEFEKIGGWNKKKLEETMAENKSRHVSIFGEQQVALFCFNGILTQRANEPIPSGPTP